jgi:glucosyl-3-phosphoglycerate synthase
MTDTPRTYFNSDLVLASVARQRGESRISVVVPAKDEATTIGSVLDAVLATNQFFPHFVSELIVVDDHSRDDTATVARRHGATVVTSTSATGKGAAMSLGLQTATGDIVVFLDGDVTNTTSEFVPRLVAPLLEQPQVVLVKAFYERPLHNMPTGGGRVTELAARPILSLLYPGLGEIRQPLAGETAGRRDTLLRLGFDDSYGVEMALLIDVARTFGVHAIAQVDLGVRRHRNRPLEELRPMSMDVLRAALTRFGVELPSTD